MSAASTPTTTRLVDLLTAGPPSGGRLAHLQPVALAVTLMSVLVAVLVVLVVTSDA